MRPTSHRGSVGPTGGAAASMKAKSNLRNVASGSGFVASATTVAAFVQHTRPATARENARPAPQSSMGHSTARPEQATTSTIGLKMLSQSKTQQIISINKPKGPDILLTEASIVPSSSIQQLQAGQQAYFTENIESSNHTPLSTKNSVCPSHREGKMILKQNTGPLFASRQQTRQEAQLNSSHSKMSS